MVWVEAMTGIGKVKFDPTINLGHVLQVVAITGGLFIAYMNIIRAVDDHEIRLKAVEKQAEGTTVFQNQVLETLTKIREDIATLKERSRQASPP